MEISETQFWKSTHVYSLIVLNPCNRKVETGGYHVVPLQRSALTCNSQPKYTAILLLFEIYNWSPRNENPGFCLICHLKGIKSQRSKWELGMLQTPVSDACWVMETKFLLSFDELGNDFHSRTRCNGEAFYYIWFQK